jgi:hypothetical protein
MAAMTLFEEDKAFVLEAFMRGEFDFMESAGEVVETDFFRFIQARGLLEGLARTYPNPRRKNDVPVSLYVVSELAMRLHGVHSFHGLALIVRSGGMLNAFGGKFGRKVLHPDKKAVTVLCEGTNRKNHYPRQTPCDPDYVRKLAKDTDAARLMRWFNTDAVKLLRAKRAFDKEGLCIGDASYLFVPDNDAYEGSVRMLFDEHNHPVGQDDLKTMTPSQRERCRWRRCYKLVSLLHVNRKRDYFLVLAAAVISGKDHECPVLYALVDQLVETLGKGVIRRLILDRGFLDGKAIARCKRELEIDVLIPLRRNMDLYKDAMALFALDTTAWREYAPPAPPPPLPMRPPPKAVRERERKRQATLAERRRQTPPPAPDTVRVKSEVAVIANFKSWDSCSVPLSVVASRDTFADHAQETWLLLDTACVADPAGPRNDYALRAAIEERHRQWKCFCNLTGFTSRAFSLVVNQVVFVLLTYNLLQLFLLREDRKELAGIPPPLARQHLLPAAEHVILYYQNRYGLFAPFELIGVTARLPEDPRVKIARTCDRLRSEFYHQLQHPRPP